MTTYEELAKAEKKIKRLVVIYCHSYAAYQSRGGGDPEGWPYIEQNLANARKKLWEAIEQLTRVALSPSSIQGIAGIMGG